MEKNLKRAIEDSKWWESRDDQSSLLYLAGIQAVREKEYKRAARYLRRAARGGEVQGVVMLAAGAEDRIEDFVSAAPKGRSEESVKNAAQAGNRHASFMVYETFRESGQMAQAVRWLNRAGDLGSVSALRELALYAEESGSTDRALEYLERAVVQGSGAAATEAALICRNSPQRGEAEEVAWWERAAHLDDVDGLRVTGFTEMIVGDRNSGESKLKRAAESGDLLSMEVLAQAYEQLGDAVEAFSRYALAADAGSAYAKGKYGLMLCRQGDFEAGFAAMREAGENGDADALANLGEMMLANGQTMKAREYFERSSKLGSETAAKRLLDI